MFLRCKTTTCIFILSFFAHLSSGTSYSTDDYDLSGSEYALDTSDINPLEFEKDPVYADEDEYVGSDEIGDIYVYRRKTETSSPSEAGLKAVQSDANTRREFQKLKNPNADVDTTEYDGSDEGTVYFFRRRDFLPSPMKSNTNARRESQNFKSPRLDADKEKFNDELGGRIDADYDEIYMSSAGPDSFADKTLRRSDVTDDTPIEPISSTKRSKDGSVAPGLTKTPTYEPRSIDPPSSRKRPSKQQFSSEQKDRTVTPELTKIPTYDPRPLQSSRRTDGIVTSDQAPDQKSPTDPPLPPYVPKSIRPSRRIVIPKDNANKTAPRAAFKRRNLRPKRVDLDDNRR